MSKRKAFKVRIDGRAYRVTQSRLVLSDGDSYAYSDNYDHPRIRLTVHRDDGTDDGDGIEVWIKFQRNALGRPESYGDKPATGYMDTLRRWSTSYAGSIGLSCDADKIRIGHGIEPKREDKVREAISRAIGREISERNLHAVTPCECERVMRALEYLGVSDVLREYEPRNYRGSLDALPSLRDSVPYDERANDKHERQERERARKAERIDEIADAGVDAARDEAVRS